MSKVAVFFANGLEECEGLLVVDLLKRAKIDVDIVSITDDRSVTSSHSITVLADRVIDDTSFDDVDMIVLPGGIPGTPNLAACRKVTDLCKEFAKTKKVSAICAAPSILGSLGLLKGKSATVYPGFEDTLTGANYTGGSVVVDGNIITANGLGAAIPFALEIIRSLEGDALADRVASQIQF